MITDPTDQTAKESDRAMEARPVSAGTCTTDSSNAAECKPQSWKLVLAYDGTDFHGWQVQPGLRTVQGALAQAVLSVTGERILPQGSGRTDTGVHAEGQAVSLELAARIPPERLLPALNRRLPAAIRILSAAVVPGFHARSGVQEKTYEYRIFPRRGLLPSAAPAERVLLPWRSRFVWDCRIPLLFTAMQKAAQTVVGTHDFSSFAARDPDRNTRLAQGEEPRSNVRTIFRSDWLQQDDLLLYRVSGSGFLHHMVRNLAGTLVEVGAGRRAADSLAAVLAAKDRRAAGPTAPPQGLFLMDVVYRQPPSAEQESCPC